MVRKGMAGLIFKKKDRVILVVAVKRQQPALKEELYGKLNTERGENILSPGVVSKGPLGLLTQPTHV